MIVRDLQESDLDEVVKIEESIYKDKWTRDAYLQDLANDIAYNYVLEHDGVILGYYGFWVMFDNVDITKVSIREELQGKGLANILMEDMLTRVSNMDVETITLEVRVSNKRAINLYSKYGFTSISVRKNYYEGIEDALIMQKRIV